MKHATFVKRSLAFVMAGAMVLALAACGKKGGSGGGLFSKPNTPGNDTAVMALSFNKPETYEKVERYVERTTDGKLVEKNISYKFSDESKLTYAYASGLAEQVKEALNIVEMETVEAAGKTFYLRINDSTYQAFQLEGDDVYGVEYKLPEGAGREDFDKVLNAVKFTDAKDTLLSDESIYDIKYTIDESLPLYGTRINEVEKQDGTMEEKTVNWYYGQEKDKYDFRFMIRVYKGSKLEDILKEDKEYVDQKIGDLEFKALKTDDDKPYEYYIQHGEDVYEIRNNGSNNSGWFLTRSDESVEAFEKFLNTIKF